MNDGLISESEVADLLNVDVSTVRRWRRRGLLSPDFERGGVRRYHRLKVLDVASLPDKERSAASAIVSPDEMGQIFDVLTPLIETAVKEVLAKRKAVKA